MNDEERAAARNSATWSAEAHRKQAKATLVHYFRLALPDMTADMVGEVEGIVDGSIDAALCLARAEQLEPSFEEKRRAAERDGATPPASEARRRR